MSPEEELRYKVEANLRLAAELERRTALVRSVFEKKLFLYPSYSKRDLINLWQLELIGYRCKLFGIFHFPTNAGELEGEYDLKLSAGYLDRYRGEIFPPMSCEIRVRGFVSGFYPVDYELVPVSMIKRLDPDGLHELQEEITGVEFLLKTIGLLPDEEVDLDLPEK